MLRQLGDNLAYSDFLEYIREKIPIECHPENLGMNLNSNITADRNESASLISDLLKMQAGKLKSQDEGNAKAVEHQKEKKAESDQNTDIQMINQLQTTIPVEFDIDAVTLKYPTKFEESLNSLLVQECGRYNTLI